MAANKLLFLACGLLWLLLLGAASRGSSGAVCSLLPVTLALIYISLASAGGLGASDQAAGRPPQETAAENPRPAQEHEEEPGRPRAARSNGPASRIKS